MRGRLFYQGRRYVLAQEPPAKLGNPADPTVEDELGGAAVPEDEARAQNLTDLGLGGDGEQSAVDDTAAGSTPNTGDDTSPAALDDLGGGEAQSEDDTPEPEDPDQLVQEIEQSPATHWKDYLAPIQKDLEQQFGGIPVQLLGTKLASDDVDVDLGFHVTGYVKFLGPTPHEILDEYGTTPLHFKIFVDPDGKLIRSSLELYTELDA